MDSLNTTDVGFVPPLHDAYQAGKASITAMHAHRVADRIQSAWIVKRLRFAKKSSKTEYVHFLWWTRFTEFRRITLNKEWVTAKSPRVDR
jgi:hypothetical protein